MLCCEAKLSFEEPDAVTPHVRICGALGYELRNPLYPALMRKFHWSTHRAPKNLKQFYFHNKLSGASNLGASFCVQMIRS
jgi:hypothetical protein